MECPPSLSQCTAPHEPLWAAHLKHRRTLHDLSEDAPHAPHVHVCAVRLFTYRNTHTKHTRVRTHKGYKEARALRDRPKTTTHMQVVDPKKTLYDKRYGILCKQMHTYKYIWTERQRAEKAPYMYKDTKQGRAMTRGWPKNNTAHVQVVHPSTKQFKTKT